MNQSSDRDRNVSPNPPAGDLIAGAPTRQPVRIAMPQSAPYVTYTIMGVTILAYFLQWTSYGDTFVEALIKSNDQIRAGELWRLLTPALLHANLTHIGFNMYALLSFGTSLERFFGHGRFFLLYLLGAFAGNVASFLFAQEGSYSVGASTAIFGLLGAEAVFLIQNRKVFPGHFRSAIGNIIFIAAINLFVIGALPGIDNWGHIGGLLGGLLFTAFAGPKWDFEGIYPAYHLVDKRPFSSVMVGAAIVVLIFGGLAMWGMVR